MKATIVVHVGNEPDGIPINSFALTAVLPNDRLEEALHPTRLLVRWLEDTAELVIRDAADYVVEVYPALNPERDV